MKRTFSLAALITASAMIAGSASAATITWGTATDISGASDVVTTGTLVRGLLC